MTATLDHYLNEKFHGLPLESPLFYNAEIGIRFEIGDPDPLVSDEKYFEQVRARSNQLFKEAHKDNDELFIVLSLDIPRKRRKPDKIKVFRKGLKNKSDLKKLICTTTLLLDEEKEEWLSYRFVLR